MKLEGESETVHDKLRSDLFALRKAGLRLTEGDIRCLLAGHIARKAINVLRNEWELGATLQERMGLAGLMIGKLREELDAEGLVKTSTESVGSIPWNGRI